MRYRHSAPEEFAVLYAIEEQCFQPPFRFSRGALRRMIESDSSVTWVAELDGHPVGFAVVGIEERWSGQLAYIQTIEVLAELRGRGIGAELLRLVESTAREAGARMLWLHVDAQNAGAIRLYEARGYTCVGREEDFYAQNRAGLIYRKPLDPEASE